MGTGQVFGIEFTSTNIHIILGFNELQLFIMYVYLFIRLFKFEIQQTK